MFQRILISRLEHRDPAVRAKAYGNTSIDQSLLQAGLKKESDSSVLAAIIPRYEQPADLLPFASHSESELATLTRERLAALASAEQAAEQDTWKVLFEKAISEQWPELDRYQGLLTDTSTSESVIIGALSAFSNKEMRPANPLAYLIREHGSTAVRQAAAALMPLQSNSEELLSHLKDKDKMACRIFQERLDRQRQVTQWQEQASELTQRALKLKHQQIIAQQELVARAHAKLLELTAQVQELRLLTPDLPEVVELTSAFDEMNDEYQQKLTTAREQIAERRQLLETLEGALGDLGSEHAGDEEVLRAQWAAIPDHSDTESRRFIELTEKLISARLVKAQQQSLASQLESKLSKWSELSKESPPAELKERIQRRWGELFRTDLANAEELTRQHNELIAGLEQRESKQLKARERSTRKLQSIFEEFEKAMEGGDLKQATSLQDRLKFRLKEHDLDKKVHSNVEEQLRKYTPKLDEFRKWRHFGTQQARENLMGEVNQLITVPPASPKKLADAVQTIREKWRGLDRDDGRASDEQWKSFSNACKEAFKPAKTHFNNLSKERSANEQKKRSILQALSELSEVDDSPDWAAISKGEKDLKIEWRKTGSVDYKVRKDLDKQFEKLTGNLEGLLQPQREEEVRRRRNMILALRQQSENEPPEIVANAAKKAQREWRPLVQSDRKTEQELWHEFRELCDQIFGNLKAQSDEKRAEWQADLDKRKKLTKELDDLLAGSGPYDEVAVKKASAQAAEIDKQCTGRSQIPRGLAGKQDAAYRSAKKRFDQRRKKLRRQTERQSQELLLSALGVCQAAEAGLINAGELSAEHRSSIESQSERLNTIPGSAARALLKRCTCLLEEPSEQLANKLKQQCEASLNERQEICLLGELITEVPSPSQFEQQRLALRMQRLKDAMQGSVGNAHQELKALTERWLSCGAVADSDWPELQARFEAISKAAS